MEAKGSERGMDYFRRSGTWVLEYQSVKGGGDVDTV